MITEWVGSQIVLNVTAGPFTLKLEASVFRRVFGKSLDLNIKNAVGIMAQCRRKAKVEKKRFIVRFSQFIMDVVL